MPEKAENLRKRILEQLREQHPKWDEEKLKQVSYATVQNIYKKQGLKLPF